MAIFCYSILMKNNAHLGETRDQRLKRFEQNSPVEVIDTIINSIANYFNNEIRATLYDTANPQTSLMILGIHSVALTIAYGLFNSGGPQGYKLFLERFIDGDTPDTKFSTIGSEIHEWRNVLAHRWLNVAGHSFSYDYEMPEGWKREGEFLLLNPKIYLEHYLKVFGVNGKIYQYNKILTTDQQLEEAKVRFISKYTEKA